MQVAFYLKRPDSKTSTAIFARVSYRSNKLKFYTEESILPKYCNKETYRAKETQKFREYPEFNARIDKIEATIKSTFRKYQNDYEHEVPSLGEFKELLDKAFKKKEKKTKAESFFGFFEHIIDQTQSGIRLQPRSGKRYSDSTVKIYRTTLKHLTNYQASSQKRVDFDTIDKNFYADFTGYMIKALNLSTNAIGKNIQTLKAILNEATERGLNKNLAYKGRSFSVISEKSDTIYLSKNEVKEIADLDLSSNERLGRVRDLFLIGCHTGLRYSDYSILNTNHIKDGYIKITQTKTGDPVTIPVHPMVREILSKYNGELPPSISNQKTNDYLKELGQKVSSLCAEVQKAITKGGKRITTKYKKWELLSSHTARRTFATNEYLAGTPSLTIMAITGHKTESSFLKYIRASADDHAQKMMELWELRKLREAV